MNKDRLLTLATHLETKVPKSAFNMKFWGTDRDSECGFAGCAIGWAIQDNLFPDLVWAKSNTALGTRYIPINREIRNTPNPHLRPASTCDVATRIRDFVKRGKGISDF